MRHSTRFRSARGLSGPSGKASRGPLAGVFGALALFAALPAQATTLTVSPEAPYSTIGTGVPVLYILDSASTVPLDQGFQTYDVSQTADSDTGRSQILKFMVYSPDTYTIPAGQNLVVTVSLRDSSNTGSFVTAPIATSAGSDCVNGQNCQNFDTNVGGRNFYLASVYQMQSQMEIGLYLNDLCYYLFSKSAVTGTGCQSGGVAPRTAGPVTLNLRFTIGFADPTVLPINVTSQATFDLNLVLGTDTTVGPTLAASECTFSASNLPYYPGDQAIFVTTDPSVFLATPSTMSQIPTTHLVVIGHNGGTPNYPIAAGFYNDDVIARVALNSGFQEIGGFQNTTNGTDNVYGVVFGVRDMAGAVGSVTPPNPAPPAPQACTLPYTAGSPPLGVQTSDIRGVLNKSNCFIATAAFRSGDAAPVMMLRRFRDRVLLPTRIGSAFVHWYYSWSPPAAEWLIDHPSFRFPVLLGLVPLQIGAWLALHPLIFVLWACVALAILGLALRETAYEAREGE